MRGDPSPFLEIALDLILTRGPEAENTTRGILDSSDGFECYTLELGWKNNAHQISCIPEGTYQLGMHQSPKFGAVWQVLNVPGRNEILIHSGNTIQDTEGCILIGKSFGRLSNLPAVLNSRVSFIALMKLLDPNEQHQITIKNYEDSTQVSC